MYLVQISGPDRNGETETVTVAKRSSEAKALAQADAIRAAFGNFPTARAVTVEVVND